MFPGVCIRVESVALGRVDASRSNGRRAARRCQQRVPLEISIESVTRVRARAARPELDGGRAKGQQVYSIIVGIFGMRMRRSKVKAQLMADGRRGPRWLFPYVCFPCRKSFKRQTLAQRGLPDKKCPDCGG
jgi:hypothetical protein